MRFVDVNPFFYPHHGGIETRMHDTARLLAARGHDVTVLTGRLPDTAEEEMTEFGYRVVRLKSRFINVYNPPYISSEGVLEALESIDADMVNYNYRWAPSYNKDLKRYDGRKVFTYHNMWGEGTGIQAKLSEMNDNAFRKTLETFDRIVCVSSYVRDDLVRRGIPEKDTVVIPTCMDLPEPSGEPEGDFILSLGRLVPTKGLEYLMEAMTGIDCKLIMCGRGPEEKGLRRMVSRLGLEDKVEFRGYVSEEEKNRLMDTCKVFVMPSLFESFGLAALEVLGHGRPLVFSDVNGLPETVGDGGIAVPPKDPKALSAAVNRLLGDDSLRAELASKARAQAGTYTWDRYIGLYEDVLSGKERRRSERVQSLDVTLGLAAVDQLLDLVGPADDADVAVRCGEQRVRGLARFGDEDDLVHVLELLEPAYGGLRRIVADYRQDHPGLAGELALAYHYRLDVDLVAGELPHDPLHDSELVLDDE